MVTVAASCAAAALAAATPALAEVRVTAQAVAAHAEWLAYAPAPSQPATVCVVDSGVTINTDLAGIVTRRVALEGGTLDDVDALDHHGTLMAMMASARIDDSGMIGAAPGAVRIVSVRAAPPPAPGQDVSFPYAAYRAGIYQCRKYFDSDRVRVVELALGTSALPTQEEHDALVDEVSLAHARGISVIAAAGNDGGPVQDPASAPGVISVGAAGRSGGLCSFSSRGGDLDLVAPGCGLDTVDPVTLQEHTTQGTSQASAFTAAALAALRAYKPELSWSQAEALVLSGSSDGGLNVEAAFRAAGLDAIVDAGKAGTPDPAPASSPGRSPTGLAEPRPAALTPPGPTVLEVSRRRWVAPRVRSAWWRRGVLTVRLRGVPRQASVHLSVRRPIGEFGWRTVKRAISTDSTIRLRVASCPQRLSIMYVDMGAKGRDSPTRTLSHLAR